MIKRERERERGGKEGVEDIEGKEGKEKFFFFYRGEMKRRARAERLVGVGERQRKSIITIIVI